jgi:hypothetical protein
MALRNPDVIGRVIGFSPGGRHGQLEKGNRIDPTVRFFLLGGTLEPAFLKIARSWLDTVNANGGTARLLEVVAGHDSDVWAERFSEAAAWVFTGEKRTTVGF